MKRNFGIRSSNAESQLAPAVKETVAIGFLIAFASMVGALFGVISFFASMLIEPGGVSQPIQYQSRFESDRHPG